MYFESFIIVFDKNLHINSSIYNKNIMTRFINIYLINHPNDYYDAIIYSKYHLYYKLFNCTYDSDIMKIIDV